MVSRHKRLLLGEVLMCSEAFDIHAPATEHVADEGARAAAMSVDDMGMLATSMNALAPESKLRAAGAQVCVRSAIFMPGIARFAEHSSEATGKRARS